MNILSTGRLWLARPPPGAALEDPAHRCELGSHGNDWDENLRLMRTLDGARIVALVNKGLREIRDGPPFHSSR